MAAVTFTAARVAVCYPHRAAIDSVIAGATLAAGDAAFFGTADGRVVQTAAGTAPLSVFDGIVLMGAGSAQATDLLREGHVAGFDLTNVVYGGTVYAGTAVSTYSDAAVGGTVIVGYCEPLSDTDRTKVLYVKARHR